MSRKTRQKAARRGTARRGRARTVARVTMGLLSVAGVAGFAYFFRSYLRDSPRFQVRTVELEGLRYLDEDTVLEAAGITSADNVFDIDLERVRGKVEELPYVRTASVSVTFPDTVVIRVVERRAFASLLINSHAYAIDEDGIVLREYGVGELPISPFITEAPGLRFVARTSPASSRGQRRSCSP